MDVTPGDRLNIRPLLLGMLLILTIPLEASGDSDAMFRPAMDDDGGYTETYTFSIDFADGGFAQVNFGITNLGPGRGRSICRVLLVPSTEDAVWRHQQVVAPGKWTYDAGPPERLRIGGCSLDTVHGLELTARTDDGELHVALHEALRPRLAPGSPLETEAGTFTARVYAAGVTGHARVLRPNGDSDAGAVRVYVEHNHSTAAPDAFAKQWFRFRTLDARDVRIGLVHRDGPSDRGLGWFSASESGMQAIPRVKISAPGDPGTGPIRFGGGEDFITLRPSGPPVDFAPLREMGLLGRVMAAVVGDPLLTVVDVEWDEAGEQRRGRLEISTFR